VYFPLEPKATSDLPIRVNQFNRSAPFGFPSAAAGTIQATQEGGLKLRVFANPHPALQCILEGLHQSLFETLRRVPTDCTFDQKSGAERIAQELSTGKTVYAFDLSNATDRFPLSLQLCTLKTLGFPNKDIEEFQEFSSLKWLVSDALVRAGFPPSLKWTNGQPLGLKGSFPLFALTHNILLRGIECEVAGHVLNQFVIVGDDVAIFDSRVAERYQEVLADLGVEVSVPKSIISATLSEFAGFTIRSNTMTRPGKHKKITKSNIQDIAVSLGQPSLPVVSKLIPRELEGLLYVPASIGGLGYKKEGKTLDELLSEDVEISTAFRILADVFGKDDQVLPTQFRASLVEEVWGKLGFSRQHMREFAHELYSGTILPPPVAGTGSLPLPVRYSALYHLISDDISRVSSYTLAPEAVTRATMTKLKGMRNALKSCFHSTTPLTQVDFISRNMSLMKSYLDHQHVYDSVDDLYTYGCPVGHNYLV
jgi:hypothetical protein